MKAVLTFFALCAIIALASGSTCKHIGVVTSPCYDKNTHEIAFKFVPGAAGPSGKQGPQGPVGPSGNDGPRGPRGCAGKMAAADLAVLKKLESQWDDLDMVVDEMLNEGRVSHAQTTDDLVKILNDLKAKCKSG